MIMDILRVARRRWKLILLSLVIVEGLAVVIVATTRTMYQSQVQIFVSAHDQSGGSVAGDMTNIYQGGLFTQQRTQSYVEVVNSPEVLQPVVQELKLGMSAKRLASNVSASAPSNTVLIDLSATNHSPALAQQIAAAAATSFISFIDRLEKPITGGASPVRLSVSSPATLPTSPIEPKTRLDIILGAILGLALGVGLAALRDRLDTTIEDPDELESKYGVPVLATVPAETILSVPADSRKSRRGEAFRYLRTNLQFVDLDKKPACLAVTSALPGEGKTTVASSLGVAAADTGNSVVVVDADLRNPQIGAVLKLEPSIGLTNCLVDRDALDEALSPVEGVSGLFALSSGPLPPNPAEVLASKQMEALVEELRRRFDLVIVDLPPLLPVTDAAIVSANCDGALVVVRSRRTKHEQLASALASLKRVEARVFGIVVNAAPSSAEDRYGYGYRVVAPIASSDTNGHGELLTLLDLDGTDWDAPRSEGPPSSPVEASSSPRTVSSTTAQTADD